MATSVAEKLKALHIEVMGLGIQRLVSEARGHPKHVKLETVPMPSGELVEKATKFARDNLDEAVFNHSLRTYFYGAVIGADQFPNWQWDPETLYLASILHDMGLSKQAMDSTVISFEYDGALKAYDFLKQNGAEKKMREVVFEAIARHSDLYTNGKTPEGFLVTMSASTDIGMGFAELLHSDSTQEVVAKYPRLNMNELGPELMEYEITAKDHKCHIKCFYDMGLFNNPNHGSSN